MIAATHKRSLEERWTELDEAAHRGVSHHSCGKQFHKLYMDGRDTVPSWAYVSALPLSAAVMKTRKQLIQAYRARHHRLPACNTNA